MQNLLIATYNFMPYALGGTEIYVKGLISSVGSCFDNIVILVAVNEEAINEHELIYTDNYIDTIEYKHEKTRIIGIKFKFETTDENYSMHNIVREGSYYNLLTTKLGFVPDILHYNGFSAVINTNIATVLKSLNSKLKVITSYHTPISCPAGTLYFNLKRNCSYKPYSNLCTACFLTQKTFLHAIPACIMGYTMPLVKSELFPTAVRIKYLVTLEIEAFKKLAEITYLWICYSNFIKQTLILNGIPQNKIKMHRHGISEVFINQNQRTNNSNIFAYVGRFEKIKGFTTLAQSGMLLSENNERKLIVIGDENTATGKNVLFISALKKRKDVIFFGKKTQTEIVEILQKVHCVIIPSEWIEIGPLVFHESIACGCNVIASDIGGNKELTNFYGTGCKNFKTGSMLDLKKQIESFKYEEQNHHTEKNDHHYEIVKQIYNS